MDAGELKQIQEWRALGGEALAQQGLAMEEKPPSKREKIPTPSSTPSTPQSLEEALVESAFDLLTRVLRHF